MEENYEAEFEEMSDDSNIVSISEWRMMKRRVDSMTLPELAMTVHRLIDVMIDLGGHLQELKHKVETLESD